jgi:N-acetylglucosaminyldiphosphoundecaprenol N-acetyl-beta-D-mannosaminyltransferase
MIDHGKKNLLGVFVDAVDYEVVVSRAIDAAENRYPLSVSHLAVHGVMCGVLDLEHRYRFNHIDIVAPDGQPVRWALNLLYKTGLCDRVYAPSLMLQLCERAAKEKVPIFLYGNQTSVLADLERNLLERMPDLVIVGKLPSLFRTITQEEKQEVIQTILKSGAGIVFVGLGCPRQEVWVYEYRNQLPLPLIGVGAAFNFHSGHLPQAPNVLQNLGLEWLYRLAHEPKRLWKRYLVLNPLYITLFVLQFLKLRCLKTQASLRPSKDLNYG